MFPIIPSGITRTISVRSKPSLHNLCLLSFSSMWIKMWNTHSPLSFRPGSSVGGDRRSWVSNPSLVSVFLCPCLDPIPVLGLILDGIIWVRKDFCQALKNDKYFNVLSAPKITNLKIWWSQFLSRFLVELRLNEIREIHWLECYFLKKKKDRKVRRHHKIRHWNNFLLVTGFRCLNLNPRAS